MSTQLEAARRYVEIGRPEQALSALSTLDSDTASTREARRVRGFALLGIGDFDRAAEEAGEALEAEPEAVDLLYLLSLAEEHRGRLAQAEAAVLAALAQDADDVELLCRYASVLMRAGELAKAGRVLDAAAQSDPDSADVLSGRQCLAYLRGGNREARRLSQELLALDPEHIRAHRMLGVLDINRGRAASAAERFSEAVRADPSVEAFAADARQARSMARNPLWWPTLFANRFGVAGSWFGAMAIILGLRAAGLTTAAGIAIAVWLVLCVWSWVAPPILERLQR